MSNKDLIKLSLDELQALAKEREIEVPEGTTKDELVELLSTPKAKAEKPAKAGAKVFYYLLKLRTHVTDEEVWERGLYRVRQPIERFDRSNVQYVECYEGSIPDKVVYDICESLKIGIKDNTGNRVTLKPVEELLEEIVIDR